MADADETPAASPSPEPHDHVDVLDTVEGYRDAAATLAVLSAGAYCASMASNYNTRGRAAELMIDGSTVHVIRERESVQDLFQHERLLPQ